MKRTTFTIRSQPTFIVSQPTCPPDCEHGASSKECEFRVEWKINAHMKEGAVETSRAKSEHGFFLETLKNAGANLIELPFLHGAFDSVFTKDNAVIANRGGLNRVLLGRPATLQRKIEQKRRRDSFESRGFRIEAETEFNLEGGDVVIAPDFSVALLGYGFRSSRQSVRQLRDFLGIRVIDLELRDPYFYHLDTALSITSVDGALIVFALREAFTQESWARLQNDSAFTALVEVTRDEAMLFGLNWVEVNDTIILGSYVPRLSHQLERLGKDVEIAPLSQFQLAGGSAACLTARVHHAPVSHSSSVLFPEMEEDFTDLQMDATV